jgi:hypothetical protein
VKTTPYNPAVTEGRGVSSCAVVAVAGETPGDAGQRRRIPVLVRKGRVASLLKEVSELGNRAATRRHTRVSKAAGFGPHIISPPSADGRA